MYKISGLRITREYVNQFLALRASMIFSATTKYSVQNGIDVKSRTHEVALDTMKVYRSFDNVIVTGFEWLFLP